MAIGSIDVKQVLEQLDRMSAVRRYAVLGGIALAVVALYWFTLFGGKRAEIGRLDAQLTGLQTKIAEAKGVAANLEKFETQQAALREELKTALERLPNQRDLPVLLTDISSLGKKSGLEVRSFKPNPEVSRGFYAEVPISVEFLGGYHDVGIFFDRLSHLSRIVNITELAMNVEDDDEDTPQLKVTGIATTFRFVDNPSPANPAKPAKPAPKRAKTAGGE